MDNEATDYLPPMNREAEEAVLGTLFIDNSSISRVREILNPHSFYTVTNQWIYEAILVLDDNRQPVDFLTVSEELRRQNRLEDIGGEAYLIGLTNTVPTSINDLHYAQIVEEAGERRRMIRTAQHMVALAHDETITLEEAIDQAMEENYKLGSSLFKRSTVHIREPARKVMDIVEERSQSDEKLTGIPTGFTDIDLLLGGFQPAELIILAGRPGMGKSALQSSIAMLATTRHNCNVGMFSLEMHATQWVLRMIAGMAHISSSMLKRGELGEQQWPQFYDAIGRLSESRLFIDDSSTLTVPQLRSKCRRLDNEYGLDMVMVDYLQLMQSGKEFRNRVQEVGYLTKGLKALAKEMNIPVVVSSQLSRAVEQRQDKRPQMSDLRDSGNIEEDADVIGFIYRDEYYNPDDSERPNIAEINFSKNRNGHTGIVDLYWNGEMTRFNNLKRQEIVF